MAPFAIDERQFREFVHGRVVTVRDIEIVLSQRVSWSVILHAIADVLERRGDGGRGPKGPPDPPQAREMLPLSQQRRHPK